MHCHIFISLWSAGDFGDGGGGVSIRERERAQEGTRVRERGTEKENLFGILRKHLKRRGGVMGLVSSGNHSA